MKKTILLVVLVLVLGLTVEVAKADFTFGTPTEVTSINSSSEELNASISSDGLSLYFISDRPGGYGGRDIWVSTRETTDDDWGEPTNLGPTINTSAGEWGVSISSDGLSLYFDTKQSGASGAVDDLWVATRETTDDDWSNPVNLGPTVNSSADDYTPSISSDRLSLYFTSGRAQGGYGLYDLWVTRRETVLDSWGNPMNLGPTVNSSAYELDPCISADGRILFFTIGMNNCGSRCGYGGTDIWMTMRATTDDSWGEPVNLGPVINSSAFECYPNVSVDGSTLFFRYSLTGRASNGDIYQAPIIPIVDFNGDGFVDIEDLLIMIDNWGSSETLCDIGPMSWGDGIVDEADLEVLMSYWGQDIGLVTHWKLDETEGTAIHDSINNIKAQLYGDPVWLPTDGMVDGALMLDGIDDFVGTWDIPGLSYGDFSVFVWIKGGAPGQVVVSEYQGVNWLMADASQGYLKTDLTATTGRSASQSLVSEVTITDGQWHRVGITWDGTNRVLYVDDVAVASDTQTSLERSGMGLNIGCGPNETSGTFWSGLIDDVRIYNRAVTP
jgi:hypothetical protein